MELHTKHSNGDWCKFALLVTSRGSKLSAVRIINQANLPAEAFAALMRELPEFGTLQQFVAWGGKRQPPILLIETVALDEYSHEVIAGWQNDLFLVFGST